MKLFDNVININSNAEIGTGILCNLLGLVARLISL